MPAQLPQAYSSRRVPGIGPCCAQVEQAEAEDRMMFFRRRPRFTIDDYGEI
jgi:hypothetical protein